MTFMVRMVKLVMVNKSNLLGLGLWFALVTGAFCAFYLFRGSSFFEHTATFSEGMETCFERLRRSYVSSQLGDKKFSSEGSFFKHTEACFSEVVFFMEKHFSISLVRELAPVHNLVTDIYWFHKDLQGAENKISLRTQFDKLENARRGIVSRLQNERKRWSGRMEMVGKLFLSSWGMAMILFLFRLLMGRKRSSTVYGEKKSIRKEERAEGVFSNLEKVSLVETLSMVLDSLANKILAQGIRVEPDIREDSLIFAKSKSLERALEALLFCIINSFADGGYLSISQEYCGGRMVLVLMPFVGDFFQKPEGQMFSTLIRESGGRLEEVSQNRIRISFVAASEGSRDKRKNRLLKGKKKDVLRQLSSWQNE